MRSVLMDWVLQVQEQNRQLKEALGDEECIDGLVFQVQEQNRQLKEALESETRKPVVGSMAVSHEMLDFKKMFAETKAHAKVWYARFHPLSLHIPINRLSPSNLS